MAEGEFNYKEALSKLGNSKIPWTSNNYLKFHGRPMCRKRPKWLKLAFPVLGSFTTGVHISTTIRTD